MAPGVLGPGARTKHQGERGEGRGGQTVLELDPGEGFSPSQGEEHVWDFLCPLQAQGFRFPILLAGRGCVTGNSLNQDARATCPGVPSGPGGPA